MAGRGEVAALDAAHWLKKCASRHIFRQSDPEPAMTATRLLISPLLALTLTACGAQTPMKPNFERNPHPHDAYRLRVVLKDPPGQLAPTTASTSYEVSNLPCAVAEKNPMHLNQPLADVPFTMNKVAENTYEGVLYLDAMQDKDYYGHGVCHWYASSPGVSFKASGKPEETSFIVSLSKSQIRDGFHTTIFYPRAYYPRVAEVDNFPVFGNEDRAHYDKLKDDELFHAEVSLDKVASP